MGPKGGYSKTDMAWLATRFALGIVLYIILCGAHPFDPYNNLMDEEIRQRIIKGKFRKFCRPWRNISAQARDLIEKLLESRVFLVVLSM